MYVPNLKERDDSSCIKGNLKVMTYRNPFLVLDWSMIIAILLDIHKLDLYHQIDSFYEILGVSVFPQDQSISQLVGKWGSDDMVASVVTQVLQIIKTSRSLSIIIEWQNSVQGKIYIWRAS